MAKPGNRGYIIPRDRDLLFRLYWIDGMTLPEIGTKYGVTHHSVLVVFDQLNIPRRDKGPRLQPMCIDCRVVRPRKLGHKLTKNGTGTRCSECLRMYKRRSYQRVLKRKPEEIRAKRKAWYDRWYRNGAINPKGEASWIRKSKALLRSAKRALRNRSVSQSPSVESVPAATSPA